MTENQEDWSELWATFSVQDHKRPETFIAEVLLYDKLIIPVVPGTQHGLSVQAADRERERWKLAGWDPARQTQVLAILNPGKDESRHRAVPIPWTADRQAEWKVAMAKECREARENGFFMTGTLLRPFAPLMAKTVVAVPQYTSLEALLKGERIARRLQPPARVPAEALLSVLGFELLVPEAPDANDFQPLVDAVAVSLKPEYRNARRALFDWQRRFVRGALTDTYSIHAGVEEMRTLVTGVQAATGSAKIWQGVKRFFSFIGVASKAAALAGPATAVVASSGSALAAIGTFVAENAAGSPSTLPAATLIADARERLGFG